jgi:hypothetical protein
VARSGICHDTVLPLDLLLRVQSSGNDQSRKAEKKSGQSSEPSGLRDVVGVQLEWVVVVVSFRSERVRGKRLLIFTLHFCPEKEN